MSTLLVPGTLRAENEVSTFIALFGPGRVLRYLIDGYNLMYAGGLLGKPLGPDAFRRVRTRFLNELANTLGAVDAHQTTIVFDASNAPESFAKELTHKGISVLFAVDDENADARIELLIAKHANPKMLTVVSTDRRIRQAAERRRARILTADDFWVELDRRKEPVEPGFRPPSRPKPERPVSLSAQETEYWLAEFAGLDDRPETREAFGTDNIPMLSDREIADLEREIDQELEW